MPAVKLRGAGVMTMEIPDFAITVTVELAAAVASAALVAATVTLAGLGMAEGAVYMPVALTFPRAVLPPGMPFTDQVRAVFVVPVTVAENCCVACTLTLAVSGVTSTLIADVEVVDFEGLRLQAVSPTVTATMHRNGVQRVFISIPPPLILQTSQRQPS